MEPASRPAAPRATFALVALAVAGAAVVGLPLFQDGSSYLLELLMTGSAVRHHRASALAIQLPAIVARHATWNDGDPSVALVRAAFCAGYALVPLTALGLSWGAVRRTRPGLFIWPALGILFVNLVNFSWVSELLIAMQLAWPPLLLAILEPGAARTRIATALLLPFVWLLHPLVAVFLATGAAACAYVAWRDPGRRRAASVLAAVHAVAALARVATARTGLTSYESSFLARTELVDYLFVSHWENLVVLGAALAIAALVLRGSFDARAPATIAIAAAAVLVSQYFVDAHTFPLKTGLVVFVAAAVMLCAAIDACAAASARATPARLDLTVVLAAIFAAVMAAKGLEWQRAVARLAAEPVGAATRCRETDELSWLPHAPYSIIDNWALPSLALVLQDRAPRTLLLAPGDCRRLAESGMAQLDPWTLLPAATLVPPLE